MSLSITFTIKYIYLHNANVYDFSNLQLLLGCILKYPIHSKIILKEKQNKFQIMEKYVYLKKCVKIKVIEG